MRQLKPISSEAIPRALSKAERYRLLNEPQEAESICLDILATQPDNQQALVMLLLATTDQFGSGSGKGPGDARAVLGQLREEYERQYYGGLICERGVEAELRDGGAASHATGWVPQALDVDEQAAQLG